MPNSRQKVEIVDLLSRWGTRLGLVITLDLHRTKKEGVALDGKCLRSHPSYLKSNEESTPTYMKNSTFQLDFQLLDSSIVVLFRSEKMICRNVI